MCIYIENPIEGDFDMSILGAFIMPHPPVILPEVGRGREQDVQNTVNACREVARRIAQLRPETIVLSSPHSIMYSDYIHISPGGKAFGNLGGFGASSVTMNLNYDTDLVAAIEQCVNNARIRAGTYGERDAQLDHGTMVPLYFVNKQYTDYRLVRIGLSGLPVSDHYRFGKCIAEAANECNRRIVFLASGDLSHRTTEDGPYGFAPEGPQFDAQITDAMACGDFLKIMSFPPEFSEAAAECGLRSFIMMAGALDGVSVKSELLSYEGPLGVGYGVASFVPEGQDIHRCFLDTYLELEKERLEETRKSEDAYVKLARHSVEHYVRTGRHSVLPNDLPAEMLTQSAGVFVSLKMHGNLRGCIGTIAPVTSCIAEEILRNGVCACAEDPRFPPVTTDELDKLVYSVDVLSPAEAISSPNDLDVKRYGLIVSCAGRRGLLLPNLEGIDTIEDQISIALKKGGIRPNENYKLERFEVVRHK